MQNHAQAAPAVAPTPFDLEDLLMQHRCKLAFLSSVFSQPIAIDCDWSLNQQAQDGLYFFTRQLREEAEHLSEMNLHLLNKGDKSC